MSNIRIQENMKFLYNLQNCCWAFSAIWSKAVLLLMLGGWPFALGERSALLVISHASPLSIMEMGQQLRPNLRWALITLIASGGLWAGWKEKIHVIASADRSTVRNHPLHQGFDRSCWASPHLQLQTNAAGIHNQGYCRGRADGWGYCARRRFRRQRAKIERKSSFANFAAYGINFYHWN